MMSATKNSSGEKTIFITKNLAIEEAGDLREELYKLINDGTTNLSLNFRDCNFIDSTGLGVMVAVYKRCVELGGSMKLYSLKPQVMKLFNLTRLDKVFEIYQ